MGVLKAKHFEATCHVSSGGEGGGGEGGGVRGVVFIKNLLWEA